MSFLLPSVFCVTSNWNKVMYLPDLSLDDTEGEIWNKVFLWPSPMLYWYSHCLHDENLAWFCSCYDDVLSSNGSVILNHGWGHMIIFISSEVIKRTWNLITSQSKWYHDTNDLQKKNGKYCITNLNFDVIKVSKLMFLKFV